MCLTRHLALVTLIEGTYCSCAKNLGVDMMEMDYWVLWIICAWCFAMGLIIGIIIGGGGSSGYKELKDPSFPMPMPKVQFTCSNCGHQWCGDNPICPNCHDLAIDPEAV